MKYIKLSICFCIMLGIVIGCIHFLEKTGVVTESPKGTVNVQKDSMSEETVSPTKTDDVKISEDDNISCTEWRYEDEKNGCYAEWKYNEQTHCLTICGTGGTHDEEESRNVDDSKFNEPFYNEFQKRNEVREIVIEEGITEINTGAFACIDNLEKVSIPNSVKKNRRLCILSMFLFKRDYDSGSSEVSWKRVFYGVQSFAKDYHWKKCKKHWYRIICGMSVIKKYYSNVRKSIF